MRSFMLISSILILFGLVNGFPNSATTFKFPPNKNLTTSMNLHFFGGPAPIAFPSLTDAYFLRCQDSYWQYCDSHGHECARYSYYLNLIASAGGIDLSSPTFNRRQLVLLIYNWISEHYPEANEDYYPCAHYRPVRLLLDYGGVYSHHDRLNLFVWFLRTANIPYWFMTGWCFYNNYWFQHTWLHVSADYADTWIDIDLVDDGLVFQSFPLDSYCLTTHRYCRCDLNNYCDDS